MKLVWVPICEKDDEEGEDDGIGPDPEIETGDTEDLNGKEEEQDDPNTKVEFLSESVDKAESNSKEPLTIKDKFQETRNFIEQELRRKSDPGPPSVIASVVPFPQTPLNVPKAQSLEEPEEESIYQSSLDVCPLSSKDTPPAIPPRIPLDNRCSPARLILPKALGRPVSPLLPLMKCSPPASPPPQKPPPPTRNYENGRRPSNYSLQSLGV